MTLEAAIAENTVAIRDLIAALSLRSPGAIAYAEQKAIVLEPPPAPEAVEVATPPKAKRQRAEKPAEPTPVVAEPTPVAPPPAPEPPPPPPPRTVTYDEIKVPFLTQLVARKGRDAGAALLREFGVPDGGKLSDIPQEKWAAVVEAIALAVST
ncbi:MAG: hypothetical protein RIR91_350 [Verrucomicrobiota bacterium]|jgi:hypothetical protein